MSVLIAVALFLTMAVGAVLASWRFRVSDEEGAWSVGGLVFPCVLAIYLISAAMGVVIGWEDFKGAEDGLAEEAGAVTSLYWSTAAFPEEAAETVRQNLRGYTETVLAEDWPRMREGELSSEGDQDLALLAASVRVLPTEDRADGLDLLTARQEMNQLTDARFQRADTAGDDLPLILLIVAAVSATIVAILPFAMGQPSLSRDSWASVNLLFVFGTVLLLLFLGNPYDGVLAVEAEALDGAVAGFDRIDTVLALP